jgi:hypothetical protein
MMLTSLSKGIDMARQRVLTLSDEQLGLLQHERLHQEHPRVPLVSIGPSGIDHSSQF